MIIRLLPPTPTPTCVPYNSRCVFDRHAFFRRHRPPSNHINHIIVVVVGFLSRVWSASSAADAARGGVTDSVPGGFTAYPRTVSPTPRARAFKTNLCANFADENAPRPRVPGSECMRRVYTLSCTAAVVPDDRCCRSRGRYA